MRYLKQLSVVALLPAALAICACGKTAPAVTSGSTITPNPAPDPPATPTLPAGGVTISSPVSGAPATSPFSLSASASYCNSQAVSAIAYWLDGSTSPTLVNGTSLNTQVAAAAGAHSVNVKAWGSDGATCAATVAFTVAAPSAPTTPTPPAPTPPAPDPPAPTPPAPASPVPTNAISVSSIQMLSAWKDAHDTGTTGDSSGSMNVVSSPSQSGSAREFQTSYTEYGGERYWISFGSDTASKNFFYDGWVYTDSSVSDVANLEMDMNQVVANGDTIIYGFQCDGYSSTWDYTANLGTPQAPIIQWLHSTQSCNVRDWSQNTWHHVQVLYSRDDNGNVTYSTVWLDGVEQDINETVNSAYALGWGSVLLTNFQVDGLGLSGSSTIYLDKLTISRW